MPQNLLAIHGVPGLVCACGEGGRVLMFRGSLYAADEVGSPTRMPLRGVYVESPIRGWAVGDGGTVLRWDGTAWSHVALAAQHEGLRAVWGCREDGLWIGGRRTLFNYPTGGSGGTLIVTDFAVRHIWGSGTEDVWFLCSERTLMIWGGEVAGCLSLDLPGDPDEEWSAVAGAGPEDPVYVVGLAGLMLRWDLDGWAQIDTGTEDVITSAVCAGPDLYVTTEGGQVRRWDGQRWSTVAFSAFGSLNAICYVDGVIWACGDRGVVIQHMPESSDGNP